MAKFKKPKDINPTKQTKGMRKNMIANLGDYAHPAKLPTGAKIGGMKTHSKSGKAPRATPRTTKSPGYRTRSASKTTHQPGEFKFTKPSRRKPSRVMSDN